MDKCRVAVFAADNGVVDEGVSCAPRSVTLQQAINMTRRKTGMSAMAAAFEMCIRDRDNPLACRYIMASV